MEPSSGAVRARIIVSGAQLRGNFLTVVCSDFPCVGVSTEARRAERRTQRELAKPAIR